MTEVEFGGFYEREYRAVVALAYALTGDRGVAADIAQDAFLAAWRDWDRVSAYECPEGWLRRVLVNMARSRWRRTRTEVRGLLRLSNERSGTGLAPSLESEAFWAEVRALPRRQAQVLALFYAEDRPVHDVAVVLGVSEGTVRALLHQGRQTLARRLKEDS